MKRRHKELSKMKKRFKFWKERRDKDIEIGIIVRSKEMTPNRFRKLHPQDCGKPRCGLCSGHKRFSEPSVNDLIAEDRERDQLKDALNWRDENDNEKNTQENDSE